MKKLWNSVTNFFRAIFSKEFEAVKKHAAVAVKVTEMAKKVIDSNLLGVLVQFIPGDVDNQVYYQLQKYIPKIAEQMAIAKGLVDAAASNQEMISALLTHARTLVGNDRALFFIEFAGRVNFCLADGKLTLGEAVLLSQLIYSELNKPKA